MGQPSVACPGFMILRQDGYTCAETVLDFRNPLHPCLLLQIQQLLWVWQDSTFGLYKYLGVVDSSQGFQFRFVERAWGHGAPLTEPTFSRRGAATVAAELPAALGNDGGRRRGRRAGGGGPCCGSRLGTLPSLTSKGQQAHDLLGSKAGREDCHSSTLAPHSPGIWQGIKSPHQVGVCIFLPSTPGLASVWQVVAALPLVYPGVGWLLLQTYSFLSLSAQQVRPCRTRKREQC